MDYVGERRQLPDDLPDVGAPVEGLAAVAVTVDAEHQPGRELRIAIEHAACAEVGTTTRPHRADARGREHGDDGFGCIRQIRDDAIAGRNAECAHAGGEHAHLARQLGPRQGRQRPALGEMQQRVLARTLVPQRVVRVVEPGARKPLRARHGTRSEHAGGRRGTLQAAELGHRAPERLEVGHRPAPQRFVIVKGATALGEPAQVAREMRARDARRRGSPEQRAFFDLHAEQ